MRQCFVWDKDRVVLIEGNRNGDDDYGVKSAHHFKKQRCILDVGIGAIHKRRRNILGKGEYGS